ncbi:MAG: glycosyltransferase family 2 protein, partial [Caulobacteraceae bacterium]
WWVLNPDTEPAPDALEIQLARLDKGDCDAVGCTLHLADGTVQSYGGHWQAWLARAISIGHGERQGTPVDARLIEARQNYLNGASMLIGRAFLERAGPMREDYFLYCEEVEWCLRARSCGLRLGFAPGAIVLHHQGSTTGNDREVGRKSRLPVRLNARNQILVTRDCFPARLPIVALAALGVILMRFGKRRAWRQLGFGLEGWAAGLADERGVPSWLTS